MPTRQEIQVHYRYHDSPLGRLLLVGDHAGLQQVSMDIDGKPWRLEPTWRNADTELDEVCRQLDAYFAGRRQAFDLCLAPRGTAFQQAVWQALLSICIHCSRSSFTSGRSCSLAWIDFFFA